MDPTLLTPTHPRSPSHSPSNSHSTPRPSSLPISSPAFLRLASSSSTVQLSNDHAGSSRAILGSLEQLDHRGNGTGKQSRTLGHESVGGTDRKGKGKGKGRSDPKGKRYFILTSAGKPVYDSAQSPDPTLCALTSTLISIHAEQGDQIKSIARGGKRIVFLLRGPVWMVAVGFEGEGEYGLRTQLEHLYLQLISITTETGLVRSFARSSGFDLGRSIQGSEPQLQTLTRTFNSHLDLPLAMGINGIQPARLPPALREVCGQCLRVPRGGRIRELLYVLLTVDTTLITLLRPRKHSIHPTDLQILMTLLKSNRTLRSGTNWVPLCLPKFQRAGFVYALVCFLEGGAVGGGADERGGAGGGGKAEDGNGGAEAEGKVGMIFLSADKDGFEELYAWKETIVGALTQSSGPASTSTSTSTSTPTPTPNPPPPNLLTRLTQSHTHSTYGPGEPGDPHVLHFIYKSHKYVQVTGPVWPVWVGVGGRGEVGRGYEGLRREVLERRAGGVGGVGQAGQAGHAGQVIPGKPGGEGMSWGVLRGELEGCLLFWSTPSFDLYVAVSPLCPDGELSSSPGKGPCLGKRETIEAANAIVRWVRKNESSLFLKEAPVF